jgi:pimeloyl-ACP methyl ester carboxylesterase
MQSIENRLTTAQPPGRNFIEPLWFDQAAEALARDHKTFDPSTGTWRIVKWDPSIWRQHLVDKRSLKNLRADVLFIHSQYDVENPYFIVKRFFDAVKTERKYIKVLPNATHLCIWETARQQLYDWTAEFILL